MVIKEIEVKDIMTKTNLPVSDYAVNPYVGCTHACKYCYASFMKRFTNHPEPWGEFVDVKRWPEIHKPGKYAGKEAFFCSVTDPYQPLEKKYGRTRALLEQLLDTGISICQIQPDPGFSDDNNYLKNAIAEAEHVDFLNGLEKQTVIAPDGTDITEVVEKAVAWLTEHSF